MVGHGIHNKPAGTWSDDTSMMLAICDSYRELRRIDVGVIRWCFVKWYREGAYTVDRPFVASAGSADGAGDVAARPWTTSAPAA